MDHSSQRACPATDEQISQAEYVEWWMAQTASKQNEDGTFAEGYAEFLLTTLNNLQEVKAAEDGLCAPP
eukprot:COSAG01_NODE_3026_length_6693_cov_4.993036_9_plen_69_part_00